MSTKTSLTSPHLHSHCNDMASRLLTIDSLSEYNSESGEKGFPHRGTGRKE